jgi:hypothetical protein
MAAGLGVIAETVFALDNFGTRGGGVDFRNWYRHVRGELGDRLPMVEHLIAGAPPVPGLLWLLGSAPAGGAAPAAETGDVRTVVSGFSRVAVEPYWNEIRRQLEREREFRAHVAFTKGFDGLLSTLHPAVSWTFPVLELPSPVTRDVYLGGNGVLLAPSLFLGRKHCAIIDTEKYSGIPAIVFPAAQATAVALSDGGTAVGGNCALGALIGHSRAAALEVLAEGCTTGELSRQLGLSLAGASKHATVLPWVPRNSGFWRRRLDEVAGQRPL